MQGCLGYGKDPRNEKRVASRCDNGRDHGVENCLRARGKYRMARWRSCGRSALSQDAPGNLGEGGRISVVVAVKVDDLAFIPPAAAEIVTDMPPGA